MRPLLLLHRRIGSKNERRHHQPLHHNSLGEFYSINFTINEYPPKINFVSGPIGPVCIAYYTLILVRRVQGLVLWRPVSLSYNVVAEMILGNETVIPDDCNPVESASVSAWRLNEADDSSKERGA